MPEVTPAGECVVLVPVGGPLDAGCDDALRELERRGYPVWKYRGYSAVDADVAFDPDDVAKLRAHNLPLTCGVYPKKGPCQFACEFLSGTPAVRFGAHGGLVPIRYCGFGFTHVRRPVFQALHKRFALPICNMRFGSPLIPFLAPVVPEPGGAWSLSEDYALCERARRCGPVTDQSRGRH